MPGQGVVNHPHLARFVAKDVLGLDVAMTQPLIMHVCKDETACSRIRCKFFLGMG